MLTSRAAAVLALILALCGCGPADVPATTELPSTPGSPAATALATTTPGLALGEFPPVPTGQLPADVAARLQAILAEGLDGIGAPGIAAAVIAANRGSWVGAVGTADGTKPLDPAAQFAIGSVTKTVTAAQVLRLVEEGVVDLDRPIADYLEGDLTTNGATVGQVLGMRSGLGDPKPGPGLDPCLADLGASISMADLREVPLGEPFSEAGTRFRYASSNYVLAGFLVEDVTSQGLVTVLRSDVLAVPGLERLVYQDAERPTSPLAAPFVKGFGSAPGPTDLLEIGGGYLPARCLASSAGPAGGMASDAMTLARWGYLLYGGWVLDDELLAAMTDFKGGGYGLGTQSHGNFVGHAGTVPGYTAQLLAFPEDGVSIAVLMNTNGSEGDLAGLAGRLRVAVLE
jgi:D-alanyl-D-alanine carboxypeptidase